MLELVACVHHGGDGEGAAPMARVIEGWSLPNDGFKFWHNPPDGCGDMRVSVRSSGGGSLIERWLRFIFGRALLRMAILVYVEM